MTLTCTACKTEKPNTEFPVDRSRESGRHPYCRVCRNAKGKVQRLARIYGLAPGDFEDLLVRQENSCAVCRKVFVSRPHVDHDHATGAVRGLLCGPCNRALGLFYDREENLLAAVDYLRRSRA